jgi:hypothetical protein
MDKPKTRKLRMDKKGTYYLSIPIRFVKAMELAKGTKLKVDMISKNKLEMSRYEE